MALVNRTLAGLTQGVSRQFEENRFETQNEEMINCIPDLSKGILRRNPIENLTDSVLKKSNGDILNPSDYFVYSYERGTSKEEMYVLLVGNREWYMFDKEGVNKGDYLDSYNSVNSVDYLDTNGKEPSEAFETLTIGDYTFLVNKEVIPKMKDIVEGNKDIHKTRAIFWIKQLGLIATSTNPSSGDADFEGHTFSITVNDVTVKIKSGNEGTVSKPIEYEVITKGGGLLNFKFYTLTTATDSATINGILNGSITSYNGDPVTSITPTKYSDITSVSLLTTEEVIIEISKQLTAKGFNVINQGGMLLIEGLDPDDNFEYWDSFGNKASFGFKGVVNKSSDLPANLPTAFGKTLIKIDGSQSDEDNYWLEYQPSSSIWSESKIGGMKNIIDETTMPHGFIRGDLGNFLFGFYGQYDGNSDGNDEYPTDVSSWSDREIGDENSNSLPSFIDNKIQDMFLHNNRLGILSGSSVILSATGEQGSFFNTTVRTIPDTDVIDVAVSTQEVVGLQKAVSVNTNLILFSQNSQYLLSSGGGVLSPENAQFNQMSNYKYNSIAKAVEFKENIIFTYNSGNGTDVMSVRTNSVSDFAKMSADNLNLHIPNYISDVDKIVAHTNLGYIFFYSKDNKNELKVLNLNIQNNEIIQNAFHTWKFNVDILDVTIIDSYLYIVSNDTNRTFLNRIELSTPKDFSRITYLDKYTTENDEYNFESSLELSKFYIKDQNNKGSKRGRIQIRTLLYTIDENSDYRTEIINKGLIKKKNFDDFVLNKNGLWIDEGYFTDCQTLDLQKNETLEGDCGLNNTPTIWTDLNSYNTRIYRKDSKITVMGRNEDTIITIKENDKNKTKGFQLSTINYELLFNSRSRRI